LTKARIKYMDRTHSPDVAVVQVQAPAG